MHTPAARHRSKWGWGVNWARLCTTPAFPPAQRNFDKQKILTKAVKIQNILDLRGVGACTQDLECTSQVQNPLVHARLLTRRKKLIGE
jgi:hypothetical protein